MASLPLQFKHPVPGVDVVSVFAWVDAGTLRGVGVPAIDTLLSNFPGIDEGGSDFRAYKFRGFVSNNFGSGRAGDDGMMLALFVKPIGATLVRSYTTTVESHHWPEVITSAAFNHVERNGASWSVGGPATQFSQWANVIKRIGEYNGLTRVTIDQYMSASPMGSNATEGLHPSRVSWNLIGPGGQGTIGEALHGAIVVPEQVEDGSSSIIVAQRTFGATPQTAWVNHVIKDGPCTQEDGYYFTTVITAQVPPNTPGES